MFQLTAKELAALTSQIAMSKTGRGGRRTLPYAFTEHGAVITANILRSEKAIQMSVFVVRAFVKMRAMLATQEDLAGKLAALEKALTRRLNLHERVISDIYLADYVSAESFPAGTGAAAQANRIPY